MRKTSEHPLVWTHRDGRRSLVLGASTDHVVGMELEEGRALLADLLERSTTPDRVYRHEWTVGDTVIWDNRGVLHRAAAVRRRLAARDVPDDGAGRRTDRVTRDPDDEWSLLVDGPILHHERHLLNVVMSVERVAGDADDVGEHLGGDATEVGGLDQFGADRRRRSDRLKRVSSPA